jgi:hypothetical protein
MEGGETWEQIVDVNWTPYFSGWWIFHLPGLHGDHDAQSRVHAFPQRRGAQR